MYYGLQVHWEAIKLESSESEVMLVNLTLAQCVMFYCVEENIWVNKAQAPKDSVKWAWILIPRMARGEEDVGKWMGKDICFISQWLVNRFRFIACLWANAQGEGMERGWFLVVWPLENLLTAFLSIRNVLWPKHLGTVLETKSHFCHEHPVRFWIRHWISLMHREDII